MAGSSGRTEYASPGTLFFDLLKAVLCVLIAGAVCIAGIRYIILKGPSPRYAEEYIQRTAPQQSEEEAGA